jgi:uracil-DNA glycosylase
MNANDIRSMFVDISLYTRDLIARKLHKELSAAILAINKNLEETVLSEYYVVLNAAKSKSSTVVIKNPTKDLFGPMPSNILVNPELFSESNQTDLEYIALCEQKINDAKKTMEVITKMRNLITPSPELIFHAFRLCDLDDVRVIILGQDPYIKPGEATGLSFSVPKNFTIPPSLKNMYLCLQHNGLIKTLPTHGDLSNWARQGVLLLNTALTTQIKKSNVHSAAWKKYTDALIRELSNTDKKLIFILFGGFAQEKSDMIDKRRHIIFEWGHPSPTSTYNKTDNPKHFKYCTVFNRTNDMLISNGDTPIDWNPDADIKAKPPSKVLEVIHDKVIPPKFVDKEPAPIKYYSSDMDDLAKTSSNLDKKNTVIVVNEVAEQSWIRPISASDPKPLTNDVLWVFTDGGASANGRANCQSTWAFYMTDGITVAKLMGAVEEKEIVGEVFKTSNNRGELTAILMALNAISTDIKSTSAKFFYKRICIVTDSKYSMQSISIWSTRWVADPIKHKLKEKMNLDLILPAKELFDLINKTSLCEFKHINSHQVEPPIVTSEEWFLWKGNDIVDKLCEK